MTIRNSVAALAPESGLLPKSLDDHALVDQWCHLVESELFDNTVRTWLLCQGKFGPYSEEVRQSLSIYDFLLTITHSSCAKYSPQKRGMSWQRSTNT
jgi:hypothetical protein